MKKLLLAFSAIALFVEPVAAMSISTLRGTTVGARQLKKLSTSARVALPAEPSVDMSAGAYIDHSLIAGRASSSGAGLFTWLRHCERSEAIHGLLLWPGWIASLRSQ